MKTVIVTACPSGIANAILAKGVLEKAAADLGWKANFECQSSVTPIVPVSADAIVDADVVVVVGPAKDLARFNGKRVFLAQPADCYADPKAFLTGAVDAATEFTAPAEAAVAEQVSSGNKRVVGITACPTGVAHTFMAAEALEEEGKALGYDVKIETRGSVGAKNQLTDEEIAAADLVFIAADIEVDLSRFNGKKMYRTSTGAALKKTRQEYERAFNEASVYQHSAKAGSGSEGKQERTGVYKHLMTGVSHMLPLVVAGGLSIALSFVFGIEAFKQPGTLAEA